MEKENMRAVSGAKRRGLKATLALALSALCLLSACAPRQVAPVSTDTVVELPMPSKAPIEVVKAVEVPEEITVSPSPEPSPTIDPMIEMRQNADEEFMKNRVNVLLLGLDRSAERENWGSFRTDTMILVTADFDKKQVDMISIPRDSYVRIYNKSEGRYKINSAFSTGGGVKKKGYEYACKTVSMLFGNIPVDYYLGFDMQVVKDVVNAMGGIDYEVDINVKMNGRELKPGMQHLDGQAVLDYSRMRKGSSDIARVDRQQRIMLAVFDQMKSTNQLFNIPKIFMAVQKNIDTNLGISQITSLGLLAATMERENINRHTVPGEFLDMNAVSYWGVSQNKLKQLVKDVFAKTITTDPEGDVYAIKKELEQKSAQMQGLIATAQDVAARAQALIDGGTLSAGKTGTLGNVINAIDTGIETQDAALIQAALDKYESLGVDGDYQQNAQSNADEKAQDVPQETDAQEAQIEEEVPDESGLIPEEEYEEDGTIILE